MGCNIEGDEGYFSQYCKTQTAGTDQFLKCYAPSYVDQYILQPSSILKVK